MSSHESLDSASEFDIGLRFAASSSDTPKEGGPRAISPDVCEITPDTCDPSCPRSCDGTCDTCDHPVTFETCTDPTCHDCTADCPETTAPDCV